MANIPEFISVLRRIRDVIYPEVESIYKSTATLESKAEQSKLAAAASATASASSAATATTRANEIKNVSAQANTLSNGNLATVSYNSTDGKFTFGLPVGAKGDKGESYTINATGTTSGRAAYDLQSVGFSYLDITLSIVYFKLSATAGDWSTGTSFGRGENGADGANGTGITSIAFISTTDSSGLSSQPGGIDTYRITLSNSNTYDISLANGNDLNINGYGDKIIPKDDDEIAIADSDSYFNVKKLRIGRLKSSLNTGFKNYIINGKFDVWQRGTSLGIAGGEGRCADMFLAYNVATTPTASRDSGPVGFYNSLKIGGANSTSNKHIIHRIEANNSISMGVGGNTKITLSLWLKADVNSTVRVAIRIPNTTDNWSSYTTPKVSNDIQIKTSWERYSVTFDLDFAYWEGIALDVHTTTAQTSIWTAGWQLEHGSVATPFEYRPYGLELSLCQRYYETMYVYQAGSYYVGAQGLNSITWVCPKRVIPSVTFSNVLYQNANSLLVDKASESSLINKMISTYGLSSVKYVVEASAEL